MKRKAAAILLFLFVLAAVAGCSGEESYSGQVVTCGGDPYFFELECDNGNNYAFVISDSTQLVWQDKSAMEEYGWPEDEWNVFSCSMEVEVVAGEKAESCDDYVDECVESWRYAEKVVVTKVLDEYFAVDAKPVIYLYPETQCKVRVKLEYDGRLTCTYPEYDHGWQVTAEPDGTLTDADGQTYNYLYWEGESSIDYDFSNGFCVPGDKTAEFLEYALESLGLNRREANEFIVYWLPLMETNEYNIISFQNETYTDRAELKVEPRPDTLIRVFMTWKSADEEVEIEPQILEAPQRQGFVVVEWGGCEVK